jgi:uncharacterized delta-60 repeat protein
MRTPTHTCERNFTFEPLEGRQMFAAGDLDTGFSLDGKATLSLPGGGTAISSDVAVQSDGKVVVVGTASFSHPGGSVRRFLVARFNVNGSPDNTFGPSGNGMIMFNVGNRSDDSATAVAIGLDGSIVVAGQAGVKRDGTRPHDFGVAKLRPNGTLDTSFDGDGTRTIRVKDNSSATDVAIQADGKIVVAGEDLNSPKFLSGFDYDFAIARLNLDGALDRTFAGSGKRIIGLGENELSPAMAIDYTGIPGINQNFGKIILAGTRTNFDGRNEYAIVRLTGEGGLDKTFNRGGKLVHKFPGYKSAFVDALLIQPSGKLVVAGNAIHGGAADDTPITLARHHTNGAVDTSFGVEGTGAAYIDFGGNDRASGVIRSGNGGLIVAGTSNGKFALAALTSNGVLDERFGTAGKVVADFGLPTSSARMGLATAPGRRFVIAGGRSFTTARYLEIGANHFTVADGIVNSGHVLTSTNSPSGPTILIGKPPAKPSPGARVFSQIRI